jgi:hypothetical protein
MGVMRNVKITFSLHPLVSEWLKLRCKEENKTYRLAAASMLATYIGACNWRMAAFETKSQVLAHC